MAKQQTAGSPIKQFFSFVLELSTVFSVGLIKRVASQMFPNKHVHVDPEDCPTRAELLPLKRKKQTITTETRKQKGQNQSNQSPKESEAMTKSTKACPTVGGGLNCSQLSNRCRRVVMKSAESHPIITIIIGVISIHNKSHLALRICGGFVGR